MLDHDDPDDDDDPCVELRVPLPNHPDASVELLWADPLGNDEYVVRATPAYAYGIHRGDVVSATHHDEHDAAPTVGTVVRPGGHRTLRVVFLRRTLPRQRIPMMDELRDFGVSYEGSPMRGLAVDVPPSADYRGVLAHLDRWRSQGRLHYDTCEPRAAGTFDESPAHDATTAIDAMKTAAVGQTRDRRGHRSYSATSVRRS